MRASIARMTARISPEHTVADNWEIAYAIREDRKDDLGSFPFKVSCRGAFRTFGVDSKTLC